MSIIQFVLILFYLIFKYNTRINYARQSPLSPPSQWCCIWWSTNLCIPSCIPDFCQTYPHTIFLKIIEMGGRGGINHQFDFLHWKIYHEKTVWKWICLTNLSYRCIWKWKKMKLFPSKCLTVGLLINQTRPIFLKFNRVLHYFFTQKRTQNTIPRPTHQQLLYLLTIFL